MTLTKKQPSWHCCLCVVKHVVTVIFSSVQLWVLACFTQCQIYGTKWIQLFQLWWAMRFVLVSFNYFHVHCYYTPKQNMREMLYWNVLVMMQLTGLSVSLHCVHNESYIIEKFLQTWQKCSPQQGDVQNWYCPWAGQGQFWKSRRLMEDMRITFRDSSCLL